MSAPLVAGAASLILSAARDADQDLDSWELRRILEKTARDVNSGDLLAFDEEMGYGLISCNNAVNNRDIYQGSWMTTPGITFHPMLILSVVMLNLETSDA